MQPYSRHRGLFFNGRGVLEAYLLLNQLWPFAGRPGHPPKLRVEQELQRQLHPREMCHAEKNLPRSFQDQFQGWLRPCWPIRRGSSRRFAGFME